MPASLGPARTSLSASQQLGLARKREPTTAGPCNMGRLPLSELAACESIPSVVDALSLAARLPGRRRGGLPARVRNAEAAVARPPGRGTPAALLPKRHSEAHSKLRFERPLANSALPRGPWIPGRRIARPGERPIGRGRKRRSRPWTWLKLPL